MRVYLPFAAIAAFAQAQPAAVGESASPPITYTVVARKSVSVSDHTITFNRVLPPVLPKRPAPAPAKPPTAEEQAIIDRQEMKAFESIAVNVNVYPRASGTISEFVWRNDSDGRIREYRAWANIDARLLTLSATIETDDTIYSWMGIVTTYTEDISALDEKRDLPANLRFNTEHSEYAHTMTPAEVADNKRGINGVEVLLSYYDVNKQKLSEAFALREATNAERLRQLRENPPEKPNIVLNFWRIAESTSVNAASTEGMSP